MPRLPGKYATIGFIVTKVALPLVKRKAKARAKAAPGSAARAGVRAAKGSPGKTSLVIGSALGAAGYLVARARGKDTAQRNDDA
jgi:hypothetical protein